MMPITLSNCVVVRSLADGGSGAGGSAGESTTDGGATGSACFACAMMLCASIRAFFVPREQFSFSRRFFCPLRHVLDFFVLWRAFLKSLVHQQAVVDLPYIC